MYKKMEVWGMSRQLKDGIPSMNDYRSLVKSHDFKNIEKYSNKFIETVGDKIQSYNNRWVPDPLHQWSRQWEYAYIIDKMSHSLKKPKKVLDLGAGMTFLPFYLQDNKNVEVTSLDYDESLLNLYETVNNMLGKNQVQFKHGDMRKLSSNNKEKFDHVYSVSVLEHTDNYEEIIKNCYKALKKKGKFSVTFDISLDRINDIPLEKAEDLLETIRRVFNVEQDLKKIIELEKEIVRSDVIIKTMGKHLKPWKYPVVNVIKPILKNGKLGSPYKKLTFCCVTVEKN